MNDPLNGLLNVYVSYGTRRPPGRFRIVLCSRDTFLRARATALAIAITFFCFIYSARMIYMLWGVSRYVFWGKFLVITLFILIDFTRRSINCLGKNESAEGCVKGNGSGVCGIRPGWMTGCE